MPSFAIKRLLVAAIFCGISASASATPPKFFFDPIFGLPVTVAGLRLKSLPANIQAMCPQIANSENWLTWKWIFARTSDATRDYYLVTGYSMRRHPTRGQERYELDTGGSLMMVAGNSCVGDPAKEVFEARDFSDVPQEALRALARDLATSMEQALGGHRRLSDRLKTKGIKFDTLSPELQEAFAPYFGRVVKLAK